LPSAYWLVWTRLPILVVISAGLLSFIFVSPVLAQEYLPGEMVKDVDPEAAAISAGASPVAAAAPAQLPEAPVPQKSKVIDKKFIAVMGALGAAESLRFTTHKLVLDHEFAEGAPWVTSVPADRHMVVKYGGFYAAQLLLAYEMKKPHSWLPGDKIMRKLWWVYPAVAGPIHIKNGVKSIRTQPPSGSD
jgi:hypothetical protein